MKSRERERKTIRSNGGDGASERVFGEFNDLSKSVGESASKLLTRIKYWRVSCRSTRPPRWSALVNPIEYSITPGTAEYIRSWPALARFG